MIKFLDDFWNLRRSQQQVGNHAPPVRTPPPPALTCIALSPVLVAKIGISRPRGFYYIPVAVNGRRDEVDFWIFDNMTEYGVTRVNLSSYSVSDLDLIADDLYTQLSEVYKEGEKRKG